MPPAELPSSVQAASPREIPVTPAPANPPVLEQATPALPAAADPAGIQALLDRWSSALKDGDSQAVAACYAPVVETYFERRAVPREAVRQSIRRSFDRHGVLEAFRISSLNITPAGSGRAEVDFLKHWQTSGYRKFSGEERERMTLASNQGVWQIVSEQQDKFQKRKSR